MVEIPWYVIYPVATAATLGVIAFACALTVQWLWRLGLKLYATYHGKHWADELRRETFGQTTTPGNTVDGESATLVGRLVLDGERTCRYEDGAYAAITAIQASNKRFWYESPSENVDMSDRPSELFLQVGRTRVQLEGRTELLVGARHWWSGRPFAKLEQAIRDRVLSFKIDPEGKELLSHKLRLKNQYPMFLSVADGDSVVVTGTIRHILDEDGRAPTDYRAPPIRYQLEAPTEHQTLRIASLGVPKFARKKIRILSWPKLSIAAVTGLLVWLGFWRIAGAIDYQLQRCAQWCPEHGACAVFVEFPTNRGWFAEPVDCRAETDIHCRQSAWCRSTGRCSAESGGCVVRADDDCRRSKLCGEKGYCTARQGKCVLGSDLGCRNRVSCHAEGHCTYQEGSCQTGPKGDDCRCVVGSDYGCQRTYGCKANGDCWFRQGKCVALDMSPSSVVQ